MDTNQAYQSQRMDLLAQTLKWFLDAQQVGLTNAELATRLELSEWETHHLFQEYLGKDPQRILQALFSPSLSQVAKQSLQVSIFDIPEVEQSKKSAFLLDLDVHELVFDPTEIHYTRFPYFLGEVFIASHAEGICQVTFEDAEDGLARLKKTYPKSEYVEEANALNELAYQALMEFFVPTQDIPVLPISVKATPFQIQVWQALSEISLGELTTYGELAQQLGDPNASRAVGTAIGSNPIALLIPCHRVVNLSGKIGHFRWESWRKHLLLAIEKH